MTRVQRRQQVHEMLPIRLEGAILPDVLANKDAARTPLLVVKHLWEFRKVRYHGLANNTVRVFVLFGLPSSSMD